MKNAHHALELFEAPALSIRNSVRGWLKDSGFKVSSQAPSDTRISAKRGSSMGLTDAQAERVMEIIVRGAGPFTAVSVYHHTAGVGPLVGVMLSDLLQDEVNALFEFLGRTFPESAGPSRIPVASSWA